MDNGHLIMPYLQYNKSDRRTLSGFCMIEKLPMRNKALNLVSVVDFVRNLTMKNRIISNKS